MAQFNRTELLLDHRFDNKTKRHYLNDFVTVLHCHHYMALYTQLAVDAGETELMENVAEETFFNLLDNYFKKNEVENLEDKIELAEQYFAAIGLGKMDVKNLGDDSGEVSLKHSHLDAGWIKKWGNYDKPINFIGAGFIRAMFSVILDKPIKSFSANEVKSIAKGDDISLFKIFKA